ncbi:hypothetical protein LXL04_010292 [Taraxacum kok-saghyz]
MVELLKWANLNKGKHLQFPVSSVGNFTDPQQQTIQYLTISRISKSSERRKRVAKDRDGGVDCCKWWCPWFCVLLRLGSDGGEVVVQWFIDQKRGVKEEKRTTMGSTDGTYKQWCDFVVAVSQQLRLELEKEEINEFRKRGGSSPMDEQEYRRNRRNRHRHRHRHREEGFGPVPVRDYWGFAGPEPAPAQKWPKAHPGTGTGLVPTVRMSIKFEKPRESEPSWHQHQNHIEFLLVGLFRFQNRFGPIRFPYASL